MTSLKFEDIVRPTFRSATHLTANPAWHHYRTTNCWFFDKYCALWVLSGELEFGFVEGKEFEPEVFLVSVAVGLSFQSFDFVVGSFERSGRDSVSVPVEDAGAIAFEGVGDCHQHLDSGSSGSGTPVGQKQVGIDAISLLPNLPQILFEVVRDGQ